MIPDESKKKLVDFYESVSNLDWLINEQKLYSAKKEIAEFCLAEIAKRIQFLESVEWIKWVRLYTDYESPMRLNEAPRKTYRVVIKSAPSVENGWKGMRDANKREVFKPKDRIKATEYAISMAVDNLLPIEVIDVPMHVLTNEKIRFHNDEMRKLGKEVPVNPYKGSENNGRKTDR